jgi:acyl-CoA synthetase (AMP-forming)/AMP-acid ligase II
MENLADMLLRHYAATPKQVALTLLYPNRPATVVTYYDLVHGAVNYVHNYKTNGIGSGDVILIILQHSVEMATAYFGAILHGAIPSIMPFLTEKLLAERYRSDLEALIAVTKPRAIVTYKEFESEVREAIGPKGDSISVIVSGEITETEFPYDLSTLGGVHRDPADIVLLQHSSGTTGLQKGVALSHKAVLNQMDSYSLAIHISGKDVIVSWLPLYHDMGLIACWLMPLIKGIPLVLMSPFDWVKAPYRLLQAISEYKGTLTWMPNFAFNFCAQKTRDRNLEGIDLSSLRAVINCSEPMRWESMHAFLRKFEPYGLRRESLSTCYAMAENVFAVTQGGIHSSIVFEDVDRSSLQSEKIARLAEQSQPATRMLGAGKVISNSKIKILDDVGSSLPDRHVGEVVLQSNCMLSGYFNRPDETEKAFLDGWYKTGDFGYLVDGELFITGRKKDLIIVGGKNIYPQDLELLAYEVSGVHPGRASAFGVFSDESGTEDVFIVAEVDTEDPEERKGIAENIRTVVSRGSAVALRDVYIVGKHWLVKTSSGKTARSANRDKYLKEKQP